MRDKRVKDKSKDKRVRSCNRTVLGSDPIESWKKLEDADFRCHRCGSQMRLSFNRIDGNAKSHDLDNLEVICFDCNRAVSRKGTRDNNQHYELAMAAIPLWKSQGMFATLNEIRDMAEVEQIGGATYLLKYIERRLSKKKAR